MFISILIPTDTSNSWDNGQDFYVVRYAEVLLSLAEAMVQKGGYVYSDVTALVNEVRQRADVNMPTVEEVEGTSLSKDELLEVIKHERRVELAFEGLRLFDLYRWKELDKAVANIENERTMYGLAYEARKFNGERDYVWPLQLPNWILTRNWFSTTCGSNVECRFSSQGTRTVTKK